MTIATVRVPTLSQAVPIVDAQGNPTAQFVQAWNNVLAQIVSSLNQVVTAINATAAAQAAADAANTAAATANASAATANAGAAAASSAAAAAQTSANAAAAVAKITNSGVTGCTITAADVGANCTATISAHTRLYGDATSHAVNSGTVTGLAYSTQYFIYYDDPTFAAAAVTYLATTSQTTAAQTGTRHLVGTVTTPPALGALVHGINVSVPGIGNITI